MGTGSKKAVELQIVLQLHWIKKNRHVVSKCVRYVKWPERRLDSSLKLKHVLEGINSRSLEWGVRTEGQVSPRN